MIHDLKKRFQHSTEQSTKDLNGDNSDQAEWYKKIKAKIGHLIHQRKVHEFTSAEANADVEHEVFHVHVKARC